MPESSACCSVPFLVFVIVALLAVAYACHHYQKTATEGFVNPNPPHHQPPVPSASIDGPAPLGYTMGDYDGIPLKTSCKDGGWRSPPCTAPLGQSSRNDTVQGHNIPLPYEFTPTANDFPTAPPIDGTKGQPRSDFMFAYNKSSPYCCPSTYSTSTGCVCSTPEQREWLQSRGKNASQQFSDL